MRQYPIGRLKLQLLTKDCYAHLYCNVTKSDTYFSYHHRFSPIYNTAGRLNYHNVYFDMWKLLSTRRRKYVVTRSYFCRAISAMLFVRVSSAGTRAWIVAPTYTKTTEFREALVLKTTNPSREYYKSYRKFGHWYSKKKVNDLVIFYWATRHLVNHYYNTLRAISIIRGREASKKAALARQLRKGNVSRGISFD